MDHRGIGGADADEGGDAACLAARLCPECGAVLSEDPHRAGCPLTGASPDEGLGAKA